MIAVNLNTKRIAFMPGLTDAVKKALIIRMWVKNNWIAEYAMPALYKCMDLTKDSKNMIDDVVYFS